MLTNIPWKIWFSTLGKLGVIATLWNVWRLVKGVYYPSDDSVLIAGVLVVGCLLFCLVCFDIASSRPSDSESLKFIFGCYLIVRVLFRFVGWRRYKSLVRMSKDVENTQNRLLMKLIANSKNTKYGLDHGFKRINSVSDFFKTQPLTNYKDYKPYIDYTFETGDLKDVTFKGKIAFYGATSGTTGNNKIFPLSDQHISEMGHLFSATFSRAFQWIPALSHLNLPFFIRIEPEFKMSPQGIRIGPLSCARPSNFFIPYNINKAASEAGEETVMYVHALLALRKRDVECFWLGFVGLAKLLMTVMESKWKQLCTDIERGEVCPVLPLSSEIQRELNGLLKPDPTRADELRIEFESGFQDIIPRIWPKASCIGLLTSGSFKTSAELLKKKYFGQIPVLSSAYLGTECNYGCQTFAIDNKFEDNYTPVADEVFFEFIPADEMHKGQPQTKRIHQLEMNEEYEIVVTNNRGLYRYRCGDVIAVVGFFNDLPLINPSYRSGQILNVANEKLTETALAEGLSIAADSLDISIVDYTAVEGPLFEEAIKIAQTGRMQGLYEAIFIEITTKSGKSRMLKPHEKAKFDGSLMEAHECYRACRNNGILQPMLVYQVKDGTFHKFRQLVTSSNPLTSVMQFKQPRSLIKHEHIRFFIENVYNEAEDSSI
ncbi:uncharacterized protein LOC141901599 [Tubulanus polymorphus]|uniref:uncharacterized protein LOC141901599 n=1 Tax=Tubulanus polymorphus TaxID=672921 RepID=UPI003DA44D2F